MNAAQVDEVFWLSKEAGYTRIHRASEDEQLVAYMKDGDQMGLSLVAGIFSREWTHENYRLFSGRTIRQRNVARDCSRPFCHQMSPPATEFFRGKQDLEKNLVRKLQQWRLPQSSVVVLRGPGFGGTATQSSNN